MNSSGELLLKKLENLMVRGYSKESALYIIKCELNRDEDLNSQSQGNLIHTQQPPATATHRQNSSTEEKGAIATLTLESGTLSSVTNTHPSNHEERLSDKYEYAKED